MQHKMTITVGQEVFEGLQRAVGNGDVSRFIEDVLRPHVLDQGLDEGYAAMAADAEREEEARQWCAGLADDLAADEAG